MFLRMDSCSSKTVIPAKAGIHVENGTEPFQKWIPAFAGMTNCLTLMTVACMTYESLFDRSTLFKQRFLKFIWFFSSLMLLSITNSWSLPSDKQQVIQVLADTADLNQSKHLGSYIGHVELTQGTTNLRASSAITQGNLKNQLILAEAKGNTKEQAHYWTQTDPNKPLLHAYADVIRYHPLNHTIELIGNARIEQGTNSLSAAKITYDMTKQQIVSQRQGTTRTTLVLYPKDHHYE